ncbi:MAG: hypothetical protein LBK71_12330 [Verrucomicrobiales bacterium]|jgi:hypothetical protein|nr:hypothetical protein [Verrucomicrobiales bacterium]
MSSQHRYIPRVPGKLIPYAKSIAETCRANLPRWHLNPATLADLEKLVAAADEAYNDNLTKSTRNQISVIRKNSAIRALQLALSPFINFLLSNDSGVSDGELASMGIRPRHRVHHGPLPPPAEAPLLVPRLIAHLTVGLNVSVPQLGHPTEFLAPPACRAAHVQYKFDGAAEWENLLISRKQHALRLADHALGQRCHFRAAWLNPRLEAGPWSDVRSLIVA